MPPYVFINGQNTGHTITINADDVTVRDGDKGIFWIKNGFDGIHSEGQNKINIIGNVIDGNNQEGIDFRNCDAANAPIQITKNWIQNNNWNGVFLNNGQYVTLNVNPIISGNGVGGDTGYRTSNIMLEKCRWITISDNPQIRDSKRVGIYIIKES